MVPYRLSLFGTFRLEVAGESTPVPPRKSRALIAYLTLRGARGSRRDGLARLLWGDVSPAQARHSLRQTISILKQILADAPAPLLLTDGDSVRVNAEVVEADALMFAELATSDSEADRHRAASLYSADLLEGFYVNETAFDSWLASERARLHHLAIEVCRRQLGHAIDTRPASETITIALRLLTLDPLQEWVHRVLIRLYQSQGRPGAALQQYNACARTLQQELGIEPEEETRRLCQDILVRRSSATPASRSMGFRDPRLSPRMGTVVLLDVAPVTRAMIESVLVPAGYTLVVVRTVADALALVPQLRHAAVLSGTGTTSGRSQLLSILREHNADVPVLFITADVPRTPSAPEGGIRFVRQPIRPQLLLENLKDVLQDQRASSRG